MKILKIFTTLFFAVLYSSAIFAQADTVIVPTEIAGEMNGAFNKFIIGDTTNTGERNNPDRVYKLERGKIYIQNATMEIDFNFTIISDDDDPNNPTRPPMVVPGYDDQGLYFGGNDLQFIFTANDKTVKFKNIILQNVGPDKLYAPTWCVQITGENVKAEFNKVVFNGYQGGIFLPVGNGYKLFVEDCVLRNDHAKTNPFMGQSIGSWPGFYADTISVINTTFFNNTSYILLPNKSIVDYILFEHNTIFTTVIQPVFAFWMTNVDFKNNIFYGVHALGVSGEGYAGGWYAETEDNPPAIISLQPIDAEVLTQAGLTEADRRMNVSNNVYFIPQRIKDYWDNSIAANDSFVVQKPVWINPRTQAMFDDDNTYPHLNIENNIIDVDPGFDATMEAMVLDSLFAFIDGFNQNGWAWEGGIIGHYAPNGDIFNIPWPLPENLSYTNATLLTAANGFPVGDLNWFPDQKAEWLLTDVENNNKPITENYVLEQNYPNPFNPTTVIEFTIQEQYNVSLDVFNSLGQKVATLINKKLNAGNYKYTFDASKLSSGIYFYRLKAGNSLIQNKKMVLLK
jgi:hypothetical protein